ncbi:hypothetical protein CKM354_001239100 [Cercospora kikuchii]|uniref:Uncharacterized protein n=1 Tax=Cercospora kikuchii TaxID=84275 RepID=A0A9P3L115_9PEZI|nr:uncharacterized protein CKM354_001239100 [Cercospora kikuchii]GIZ49361.1 hypothetical protein CKM354_001239100 [Cercospora kikuchii]
MAIDLTRIRRIQSKARKLAIVLLFFTAICLLITSSTQSFPPLPRSIALHATDGRTNTLGPTAEPICRYSQLTSTLFTPRPRNMPMQLHSLKVPRKKRTTST